ncbi:MAG: hypothetical protein CK431_18445, partial [Mycobacterium sp.]
MFDKLFVWVGTTDRRVGPRWNGCSTASRAMPVKRPRLCRPVTPRCRTSGGRTRQNRMGGGCVRRSPTPS